MPRIARVVAVGVPHHVTQRGNNRQQIFFSNAQRRYYLALLAEQARRSGLRVWGYCLMPNHIHAVVTPRAEVSMAQAFGRTHQLYAQHLNALRRRSGHLWQNRFYSAPLGREHLIQSLRYVDLNPVRARLVERAEEYPWSSARAHLEGGDPTGLIDFELWREACPRGDWAVDLRRERAGDEDWAERLRAATHAGKPLGERQFVAKLEDAAGIELVVRPVGRPRKKPLTRAAASS